MQSVKRFSTHQTPKSPHETKITDSQDVKSPAKQRGGRYSRHGGVMRNVVSSATLIYRICMKKLELVCMAAPNHRILS